MPVVVVMDGDRYAYTVVAANCCVEAALKQRGQCGQVVHTVCERH